MQAVKLNFPLAKSAGNLYQAQKNFPHSKTWVGQALGQIDLPAREDSLLGLAFSYDFSEKDAPKVTETLSHFTSVDFSMGTFSGKVLAAMLASPLVELRLDFAALSKEDLENLAKQESIETLWFTGASLRDEQLVHLGPLPKLTSLALKSTALSSRALELMSGAGFQSLRRLHLPAKVYSHRNAVEGVERGNIVSWRQEVEPALLGQSLELGAVMDRRSILGSTVLLFATAIAAALALLALGLYLTLRRGRRQRAAQG